MNKFIILAEKLPISKSNKQASKGQKQTNSAMDHKAIAEWERLKHEVNTFDLSPVGKYLSATMAYDQVFIEFAVTEFRRFMILKGLKKDLDGSELIPSPVIRTVWIATTAFPKLYQKLCSAILGKQTTQLFDHDPNDTYENIEDKNRYEAMLNLYKKVFFADPRPDCWSFPALMALTSVPNTRSGQRRSTSPDNHQKSALHSSSSSPAQPALSKRQKQEGESGASHFMNPRAIKLNDHLSQYASKVTPLYSKPYHITGNSYADNSARDVKSSPHWAVQSVDEDRKSSCNRSAPTVDGASVKTSKVGELRRKIVENVMKEAPDCLFGRASRESMNAAFGFSLAEKWKHTDGTLYIRTESSGVLIGVIQLRNLEKLHIQTGSLGQPSEEEYLNINWMFGNPAPGINVEDQKAMLFNCLNLIMKKALEQKSIAGLCTISSVNVEDNPCCVAVQKIFDKIGMRIHGQPFSMLHVRHEVVRYIRTR